ncbi:MAG: arsenate reductase (glutaredoxin) [Halobacteriovorax sp.]|nr:arsenate reductase (glutaredoxin) [Halobacteriovorax sp.]|tara:strand:- start:1155 stop:1502 length:348 start_codon:yes stop_codon:yes gene_type:complete
MSARLIHNPRCSKSRQALAILEEKKVSFDVVEYLKNPLSESELDELFSKLGKEPLEVIRTKETVFKDLNLKGQELSRQEWIKIIAKNPILLERPIFDNGNQAVIGRPPENLLSII